MSLNRQQLSEQARLTGLLLKMGYDANQVAAYALAEDGMFMSFGPDLLPATDESVRRDLLNFLQHRGLSP